MFVYCQSTPKLEPLALVIIHANRQRRHQTHHPPENKTRDNDDDCHDQGRSRRQRKTSISPHTHTSPGWQIQSGRRALGRNLAPSAKLSRRMLDGGACGHVLRPCMARRQPSSHLAAFPARFLRHRLDPASCRHGRPSALHRTHTRQHLLDAACRNGGAGAWPNRRHTSFWPWRSASSPSPVPLQSRPWLACAWRLPLKRHAP